MSELVALPTDPEDSAPADPLAVGRAIALRYLERAPRSRKEVADRLASRLVPVDIADEVLNRLAEVGLVDDEAYAHMLVRSRTASKRLARRALKFELLKKGIDKDIIDTALGDVSDDDELEMARALVERKLRSLSNVTRDVRYRRLSGMLARKGYSGDVISRTLANLD